TAGASTGRRTISSWCRHGPGTSTPMRPNGRTPCCSRSTIFHRCMRSGFTARKHTASTTATSRSCIDGNDTFPNSVHSRASGNPGFWRWIPAFAGTNGELETAMTIRLHRGDLPDLSRYRVPAVAIDTETMGLDPHRDRLCVVQLSPGDGSADV